MSTTRSAVPKAAVKTSVKRTRRAASPSPPSSPPRPAKRENVPALVVATRQPPMDVGPLIKAILEAGLQPYDNGDSDEEDYEGRCSEEEQEKSGTSGSEENEDHQSGRPRSPQVASKWSHRRAIVCETNEERNLIFDHRQRMKKKHEAEEKVLREEHYLWPAYARIWSALHQKKHSAPLLLSKAIARELVRDRDEYDFRFDRGDAESNLGQLVELAGEKLENIHITWEKSCEDDSVYMTIAHFGMIYESKDAKREHGPVWSRRDKDKARGLLENGGPFYRDVGTEDDNKELRQPGTWLQEGLLHKLAARFVRRLMECSTWGVWPRKFDIKAHTHLLYVMLSKSHLYIQRTLKMIVDSNRSIRNRPRFLGYPDDARGRFENRARPSDRSLTQKLGEQLWAAVALERKYVEEEWVRKEES